MSHSQLSVHDVVSARVVEATHIESSSNTRWVGLEIEAKDGSKVQLVLFAPSEADHSAILGGLMDSIEACSIRHMPPTKVS